MITWLRVTSLFEKQVLREKTLITSSTSIQTNIPLILVFIINSFWIARTEKKMEIINNFAGPNLGLEAKLCG